MPAWRRHTPCLHGSPAAPAARVRCRRHPHPFAPFTAHSAREWLALRLAVPPLHPPLCAGLSCRHGVSRNGITLNCGGFYEHDNTCCLRRHLSQIQLRQHFRPVVRSDRF
ncbi:TPA: hypothetical protein JJI82_22385 [Cronobacter sakazakii]|nr:hypothetical protein [Cronobacter sakazakii]